MVSPIMLVRASIHYTPREVDDEIGGLLGIFMVGRMPGLIKEVELRSIDRCTDEFEQFHPHGVRRCGIIEPPYNQSRCAEATSPDRFQSCILDFIQPPAGTGVVCKAGSRFHLL